MQNPNTKLVTVNYAGGYGGDFFCNLLRKAIDPTFEFQPTENNRYKIEQDQPYKILKLLGITLQRYRAVKYKSETNNMDVIVRAHTKYNSEVWVLSNKMFNVCYDDDEDVFLDNVKLFLKQEIQYPPDNLIITNFHNVHTSNAVDLNQLFPGSKNILLVASSLRYHAMFELLMLYKLDFQYILYCMEAFLSMSDTPKMFNYTIGNKPISPDRTSFPIDVGKLFFEMSNIEQVEQQLSEFLGCNISLDRDRIISYNLANIGILQSLVQYDQHQDDQTVVDNITKYIDAKSLKIYEKLTC